MSLRKPQVLASLLMVIACRQGLPGPDVIAAIDDQEVLYADFERYLEESAFDPDAVLDSRVLSALLDQMIDERLLWRLATDRQPDNSSLRGREAVERLLSESARPPVTDAEIAQYFRLHQEHFERPERIFIRQILLDDAVAAADLRQVWSWGAPYEEILERVTEIPNAFVGEEGEFRRDELPRSFSGYLFSLEPGTVSEVITTDYGYHVIQVVERLEPSRMELKDVSEEIRVELDQSHLQNELEGLVASARERYNVRVYVRNVPFNYEGVYESFFYEASG